MKLRLTLFFVCLSAFLFTISGSALAEEKTTSGGAVDISAVSAVLIEEILSMKKTRTKNWFPPVLQRS